MSALRAYIATFSGFERDARLFLLTTLVSGAAVGLYWIDFNLYLASIDIAPATIGLIATTGALASAVAAFPASILSDRIGRRLVLLLGAVLMCVALVGFLATRSLPLIFLFAAFYAAGQQAFHVVQSPFLTEHSRQEHRSELFAIQFAVSNVTNIAAALLGGAVATAVASSAALEGTPPDAYRVLLFLMLGLTVLSALSTLPLTDDRPGHRRQRGPGEEPDRPRVRDAPRRGFGVEIRDRRKFAKLLLPGFLVALGAGQVIPFLNLFVQRKFGLDLAALNGVFALTSLGTVVAILVQPALARRLGKVGAVVTVQGMSIPFLLVLGFSPFLWTVILAMAVRNSLMNAGNPILNAFAMEQVRPAERATLAAAMSLLWSLGWVIAGPWYSLLQSQLGFEAGYAVNFLTITVLYSTATMLYWHWFRDAEAREPAVAPA